MFNFTAIDTLFCDIKKSQSWLDFTNLFKKAETVVYIGQGGNLGIADHASIDAARHSGKKTQSLGSAIWCTSLINDYKEKWIEQFIKISNPDLVILFTASATDKAFDNAVNYCKTNNKDYFVITGKSKFVNEIYISVDTYHEFEVCALALTYQLLEAGGYSCPKIK